MVWQDIFIFGIKRVFNEWTFGLTESKKQEINYQVIDKIEEETQNKFWWIF